MTSMSRADNPTITSLLRWFTRVEFVVLAGAGGALFFLPDVARQLWPWELAPFNTRFLGAIYLASLLGVALLLWAGRWEPARLVVPFILTFTTVVFVVSVLTLTRFEPFRLIDIAWFGLYAALPVNAAYYLWTRGTMRSANPIALPSVWRTLLLLQGLAGVLYGAALLLIPADASAFWPWRIDEFHARMYSAVFLTGGVGSLILSRSASRVELATMAAIQGTWGAFAILGLVIVDLSARTVAWSAPGTLVWMGTFAAIVAVGIGLLRIADPAAVMAARRADRGR